MLRLAPEDAPFTLRRRQVAVTIIFIMRSIRIAQGDFCLYFIATKPISYSPVRSMVGRALIFWSDTRRNRLSGFPEPELHGSSVDPLLVNSTHAHRERLLVMRISGTVKFFNGAKGFGFITPEDGSKDVFVHASALEMAGLRSLNEGDKVTFILEDDRKGRGKQAGEIQKA